MSRCPPPARSKIAVQPAELESAEELGVQQRRRSEARAFFREMERNIYRRLARGEPLSALLTDSAAVADNPSPDHEHLMAESDTPALAERTSERAGGEWRGKHLPDHQNSDHAADRTREGSPKEDSTDSALDKSRSEERSAPLSGVRARRRTHVRRNTGGTIFVGSTIFSPNIEATIMVRLQLVAW